MWLRLELGFPLLQLQDRLPPMLSQSVVSVGRCSFFSGSLLLVSCLEIISKAACVLAATRGVRAGDGTQVCRFSFHLVFLDDIPALT